MTEVLPTLKKLERRQQDMVLTYEDETEYTVSYDCLLYTSPSPRDLSTSRMPSSA